MSAEPAQLMRQYCDGDAGAFRALYGLLAPRLLGYLTHMARDRAVAEDLLQQTFMKVHRAREAYVRGADPVPWIYAIAHRTFLDEARRQKRAISRVDREGEVPEVAAAITGQAQVAAEEAAPRHDPELAAAALAALDALPPQQREAVVLTKLDGKSIQEAAEIAGTTPGAMKVRAHRGYVALRKLLGGTS
ncbi:MAG: RNA polymerase sigma factor [Kofleriaceae bacterium]|nr:RNA polymerase sigma factor [Myxococcales bacterium]MCB9574112.1 RNA polymerase sigma factor [Kofleriaceae bacterium]